MAGHVTNALQRKPCEKRRAKISEMTFGISFCRALPARLEVYWMTHNKTCENFPSAHELSFRRDTAKLKLRKRKSDPRVRVSSHIPRNTHTAKAKQKQSFCKEQSTLPSILNASRSRFFCAVTAEWHFLIDIVAMAYSSVF